MTCPEAKSLFSPYLDGMTSAHQMRALSEHMEQCRACAREYLSLKWTQSAIGQLGRVQPPPELTLKLRVMASREAARRQKPLWASLRMRLSHTWDAFMVPATAGALTAIAVFGLLIGFFAMPSSLQAYNNNDVSFYTPPQLVMSPFASGVASGNGEGLVVEAVVDTNGRVQDFRIISAPPDYKNVAAQLQNALLFMQFQPARSFGLPTTGRAVLSFSKIIVHG